MKKLLFLGAAALALSATSCSSDEDVKSPAAGVIEFGDLFVDNATRATDLNNTNLEDFKVWGFMGSPAGVVFDGETVSKTAGVWTYNNLQYWTASKSYWFSGVAPATGAHWTFTPAVAEAAEYNGGGVLAFNNREANGEQDLIYAWSGKVTCETPSTMKKVGMTFDHMLSRVMFTFQNDMKNVNTTIVVKNVRINDAYEEGSIDMTKANPLWSVSKPTLALGFSDFGGNIAITDKGVTGTNYLIPADHAYNLTFTVELWQGGNLAATYNHDVTMPQVDMQRGYSYNFVTKLNADNIDPAGKLYPIEFEVNAVNDWNDAPDTEIVK